MLYAVAAFSTKEENAVLYRKAFEIDDALKLIKRAFEEKGAEFVSIRKIELNGRSKSPGVYSQQEDNRES